MAAKNADINVVVSRGGVQMWAGTVKAPADTERGTFVVGDSRVSLIKKVEKEVAFKLLDGDVVTVL